MRNIYEYRALLHDITDFENKTHKIDNSQCFVYFLFDGEFVKIGVADDIASRIRSIQTSNARKIELLAYKKYKTRGLALYAEKALHEFWGENRLNGEWFDIVNDDYFKMLMRTSCVKRDTYIGNKTNEPVKCIFADQYGKKTEDIINFSKQVKRGYICHRTINGGVIVSNNA